MSNCFWRQWVKLTFNRSLVQLSGQVICRRRRPAFWFGSYLVLIKSWWNTVCPSGVVSSCTEVTMRVARKPGHLTGVARRHCSTRKCSANPSSVFCLWLGFYSIRYILLAVNMASSSWCRSLQLNTLKGQ